MLSRTLFHAFRPLSSAAEVAVKARLTTALENEVLKKPMNFNADGLSIETTLKDGILVKVYPGAEDKNTLVTVSKDGVSIERELKETWLSNWCTTRTSIHENKPIMPKQSNSRIAKNS